METMSGSLNVNFNFSRSVVRAKMIFKYFSYINTRTKKIPYCGPILLPGATILTNLLLYYIRNISDVNLSFSGSVALETKISR
jgi:hypothetical protein